MNRGFLDVLIDAYVDAIGGFVAVTVSVVRVAVGIPHPLRHASEVVSAVQFTKEDTMFRKLWFAIVVGLLATSVVEAKEPRILLRVGLSNAAGVVGVETQFEYMAFGVGWLPKDIPRMGWRVGWSPKGLQDLYGIEDVERWPPRIAFAVRMLPPDTSGPVISLSFATNDAGYITRRTAPRPAKTFHLMGLSVGYRATLEDQLDVTLGVGYGTMIGRDREAEKAGIPRGRPIIDLMIGVRL